MKKILLFLFMIATINAQYEVISPNGGEIWRIGQTYDIIWTSDLSSSGIFLYKNGNQLEEISGDFSGTTFSWTIPSNIEVPSDDYQIVIDNPSGPEQDYSDGFFTIVGENDIIGCIDSYSDNYNPEASWNDGSCTYPDNGDYSLNFDGDGDYVLLDPISLRSSENSLTISSDIWIDTFSEYIVLLRQQGTQLDWLLQINFNG
ncbi:MAG: hypothetical protein VX770_06550, partial [Candidatus Neomarinimicrobiota bacterium]|nr:hypothetical protein [Candidatus Neomarinimicrobiota bacterium]